MLTTVIMIMNPIGMPQTEAQTIILLNSLDQVNGLNSG